MCWAPTHVTILISHCFFNWSMYYPCTLYNPDMHNCTTVPASKLPTATAWVGGWPIFWFKLQYHPTSARPFIHNPRTVAQNGPLSVDSGAISAPDFLSLGQKHQLHIFDQDRKRKNLKISARSGKTCCVCRGGEEGNTAIQVVCSAHPITNTAGTLPYSWLLPVALLCCYPPVCIVVFTVFQCCHAHKVPQCRVL